MYLKFVPEGPVHNKQPIRTIGSDNNLTPDKQQAIDKPKMTQFTDAYMLH